MLTAHATDPLAVHRAVMAAAGPEALASIVRPLTDEEEQLVDDYLAELAGLDDAAMAVKLRIPVEKAAEFRRLMGLAEVSQ